MRCVLQTCAITALLGAAAADAAVVTRGPYLQRGATQSVVVRWRTDDPTDSRVRYGPSADALSFTRSNSIFTTEHEVTLTGLAPGERVYYAVGSSAGDLAGPDAETWYDPPPPGVTRTFRVWILGDSGRPSGSQARVRDAYFDYTAGTPTDVWLMLGDNAYEDGTDAEYQAAVFDAFAPFLRTHVLWPTRGNHERLRSGPHNDYYEFFTLPTGGEAGGVPSGSEAYYSFDYADAHFVCLDSEGTSRARGDAMLAWLEADLAATDRRWIIAFWHHPPYSKGTHDSDTDTRMTEMRENALPILEAHGVDLVVTGHSHVYERSFLLDGHYGDSGTFAPSMIEDDGDGRLDGDGPYRKPVARTPHSGAVYVVMGVSYWTAPAPLDHPVMAESMSALGSFVLDVSAVRLDGRFLDEHGVVRDSFRIEKSTATGLPGSGIALALAPVGAHPALGSVTLGYRLPEAGHATIDVTNAAGRRVRTLLSEDRPAGAGSTHWDGNDDAGRRVSPGVYFASLRFAGSRTVARIVLER
jgi:hypothetical protein